MSDTSAEDEGEYESGRPLGLYILVGVVVALVAISGLFAVGYIPPIAKLGGHTTTTTTRSGSGSVQFITLTSTYPGPTTTVTLPGQNTTLTTSTTLTSTSTSTSTSTQTSTQTVTSTSTTTTASTVYTSTTTTSTTVTTTSTTVTSTTTNVLPPSAISIDMEMKPGAVPATLHPGESFVLNITVQSTLPSVSASLDAIQATPGNTPLVTSFYPNVPESLMPALGKSYYTISGTISQNAPTGSYEVDVSMSAQSPVNNTRMTVTKQFLINLVEPIDFTGYKLVNPTTQFNGTCATIQIFNPNVPTWLYQCGINAAPMVNGTLDFNVTNSANVPICIQTSLNSNSMTGFVNLNPYPFCPDGASGVYIPADTNYVFSYLVENGITAGAQTVFFTFQRLAT